MQVRMQCRHIGGLRKQQGSVSTEWTISTLIMIAALFAPLAGDGQSVMAVLMESLQGFHKNGSAIFSLP